MESRNPNRAVVFDFDGVILESHTIKTEAFQSLFEETFSPEAGEAMLAYHLDNFGISRYQKIDWYYREHLGCEDGCPEDERRRLGEAYASLVLERVVAAPFVPGALNALDVLRKIEVPLFVASGTPYRELKHIVEARGLTSYFCEVWGSPALKPDILRDLMDRYGYVAEDILFVGDGTSDWRAACEVGVQFLARTTDGMEDVWTERHCDQVPDLLDLPKRLSPTLV